MVSETDYKKMIWHSRRGMLELDLLLLPFAREKLPLLDESQQLVYQRLLQEEDQDLFACLVDRAVHPDAALQALVEQVREYAAQQHR